MRKYLFLLFFSISGCFPAVEGGTAKVVSIADGDTFTVLTSNKEQVRIRLHGIDCPERGQDFGTAARQKLSSFIFGQYVQFEEKDTDRYGRTIAVVYNQKGISVNEQMLQEGLAWHYKEYDNNPGWDQLERNARRKKIGIWSQPHPTPPWLFRKAQREKNKKTAARAAVGKYDQVGVRLLFSLRLSE